MTFFEQSVFFGVSVSLAAYGIGVLLQKLEETGHDKDTVIMLAPDHYPYCLLYTSDAADEL